MTERPAKHCATCGRSFAWRRKWAACWEQVRHCSQRCARRRPGERDLALERVILELVAQRVAPATICPSEAARRACPEHWPAWLERTRAAARRLVARGVLEIVQGGRVVDASQARGPIRLRARRR